MCNRDVVRAYWSAIAILAVTLASVVAAGVSVW